MMQENEGSYSAGFVLGFFLGFIGLLIAFLSHKEETRKGSLVGFAFLVVLGIIVGVMATI